MVFAGDKCAPGMYNLPFYLTLSDPMHNGGLLLSPVLHKGFTVTVIDMDHTGKESDRVIKLNLPEQVWDLAALLRDEDRFAIEAVHSRVYPDEQFVSVAATRLHNVAGKYTGNDPQTRAGKEQKGQAEISQISGHAARESSQVAKKLSRKKAALARGPVPAQNRSGTGRLGLSLGLRVGGSRSRGKRRLRDRTTGRAKRIDLVLARGVADRQTDAGCT